MKTALVVDDDKDIRDMLSVALSAEGWLVQTTDTLLGAISILTQKNDIHCMLLDYNLPGMPMEDFLRQVRGFAPSLGVILVSALDTVAEKAEKYKISFYLGKPIDFDELRKAMNACCAP